MASFNQDGAPRLIEVKTTTLGKSTPFFLSRNELAVSRHEQQAYQLYRLFDFHKQPQFYRLRGALDQSCLLEPRTFTARATSAGL